MKESAGRKKGNGATGHGNRYLARVLGKAAVAASRTDTFLGERYRWIARRRGKKRAIVAVGRSILNVIWHLLSDDNVHFHDLGPVLRLRVNLSRRTRQPRPGTTVPRLHSHPRTRRPTDEQTGPGSAALRRELSRAKSPLVLGLDVPTKELRVLADLTTLPTGYYAAPVHLRTAPAHRRGDQP